MHRQLFNDLARFCVEQYRTFDPTAWMGQCGQGGQAGFGTPFGDRLMADAAKYLSMTSWYGHADELEKIALTMIERMGASTEELLNVSADLHRELNDIGLDLVHFSTMVRYGIAADRLEHPHLYMQTPADGDDDGDFVDDDDAGDFQQEALAA